MQDAEGDVAVGGQNDLAVAGEEGEDWGSGGRRSIGHGRKIESEERERGGGLWGIVVPGPL
jgi:hypothetical protein